MSSRIIFISFVFLFSGLILKANEIDRNHWRELKDGIHYKKASAGDKEAYYEDWSESVEEEKGVGKSNSKYTKRKKSSTLKSKPRKTDSYKPSEMDETKISGPILYMIYAVVAIILIVVIYLLFFKNVSRSDKKVMIKEKEEIQVNIPISELELMLAKAIQEGKYRDAVRIYFIFIIKILKDKNWISWEERKTNGAYLFEMRNRNQFTSFSKAVFIFEVVWYGNREITAEQYEQIKPEMESLLSSIKKEG